MQKVLLKVSGVDAPGISARIMKCIQQIEGTLEDIEQVVTQGLLSLMILTKVDSKKIPDFEKSLKTELSSFSELEVKIQALNDQETPIADPTNRFVITVIAKSIPVDFLSQLTESIAAKKYNIDSLRKLTSSGLSTIELICSSKEKINIPQISEALVAISSKFPGVDIAIQKENLYRRSKRLIVFDMDSTLVQGEVIDELAALVGKKDEVSALTKRAMEGEIDFQESLLKRVSLLRGLTKKDLELVHNKIQLTPGAERLVYILKKLGYRIAIISGGFTYFVEKLKSHLGIHYAHANSLEFDDDALTGRLTGLIVDGRRKADLMELIAQQEGILLDQVIAVGDGANDMQMLKKAGLGIAFNAKAFTKSMIGTSITHKSMDSILYLLGITDEEIREMEYR